MSVAPKINFSHLPAPEADVFYNTQWACRELLVIATMLRDAAVSMERARVARDYAGMRSAWLTLTDSPHADLGAQSSAMIGTIGKVLTIHAPKNGSET